MKNAFYMTMKLSLVGWKQIIILNTTSDLYKDTSQDSEIYQLPTNIFFIRFFLFVQKQNEYSNFQQWQIFPYGCKWVYIKNRLTLVPWRKHVFNYLAINIWKTKRVHTVAMIDLT